MKKIKKLLMTVEILAAVGCGYMGLTITTPFILLNMALLVIGVVLLLDGLGKADEINGNGPYNPDKS